MATCAANGSGGPPTGGVGSSARANCAVSRSTHWACCTKNAGPTTGSAGTDVELPGSDVSAVNGPSATNVLVSPASAKWLAGQPGALTVAALYVTVCASSASPTPVFAIPTSASRRVAYGGRTSTVVPGRHRPRRRPLDIVAVPSQSYRLWRCADNAARPLPLASTTCHRSGICVESWFAKSSRISHDAPACARLWPNARACCWSGGSEFDPIFWVPAMSEASLTLERISVFHGSATSSWNCTMRACTESSVVVAAGAAGTSDWRCPSANDDATDGSTRAPRYSSRRPTGTSAAHSARRRPVSSLKDSANVGTRSSSATSTDGSGPQRCQRAPCASFT